MKRPLFGRGRGRGRGRDNRQPIIFLNASNLGFSINEGGTPNCSVYLRPFFFYIYLAVPTLRDICRSKDFQGKRRWWNRSRYEFRWFGPQRNCDPNCSVPKGFFVETHDFIR